MEYAASNPGCGTKESYVDHSKRSYCGVWLWRNIDPGCGNVIAPCCNGRHYKWKNDFPESFYVWSYATDEGRLPNLKNFGSNVSV